MPESLRLSPNTTADLPFPHSLPEFQRLFPDDAACAAYLEKARWGDGFACPHCGTAGEPFHFENRPGVLRCRKCRQNTGLTVGTVMERSHTPLNVWFWAAYLVASQTPGMSAVQFQRQLGLSRYETAFQILHKLRSGMVRPNQDRIGGQPKNHVEVDETWVGGRTRGEGRGVHHKVPVSCAIEVRHRKPGTKLDNRKDGRYAGRVRLAVVLDRSAESLCGFVESTVAPRSLIVTDDWSGYAGLGKRGYEHFAVAECGDPEVAEQYLPIIHLVFANVQPVHRGSGGGLRPPDCRPAGTALHLGELRPEFPVIDHRKPPDRIGPPTIPSNSSLAVYAKIVARRASTSSMIGSGTVSRRFPFRAARSRTRGWSQRITPVVRMPASLNE